MAKVGDTLRLRIERIVPGGDGLARHEGLAALVPASAPGDLVSARVAEARPGFLRSAIVEVLEPGPGRVEPACPLYGICGGCDLMHLSYDAQLEAKAGMLADAWRRAGRLPEPPAGASGLPEIVGGEPFGYRNRAQFHVAPGGELGYSAAASSSIVPVASCPILAPRLGLWLEAAARGEEDPRLSPRPAPGARFVAFADRDCVYLEGPGDERAVAVAGRRFRFRVGGFFQSNLGALESLIPELVEGLEGESAADLYCGVGLFGSFLRERFERLVCVERDGGSIACARSNVDADFAAMGVEDWTAMPRARGRFDHVVVDPPRAGLSERVRSWLASSRPRSIGYVSCDPVSLARDAGHLVRAGYSVTRLTAFDFYPQTSHLETYARFELA